MLYMLAVSRWGWKPCIYGPDERKGNTAYGKDFRYLRQSKAQILLQGP